MEKICVIFGAGEVYEPRKKFSRSDLIIAADGGYRAAHDAGLQPDVFIGDFDSAPEPLAEHVIKLNRDKDDTDLLAAVKLGLRREYKNFVIYGGTGGRPDHTFANISVLSYLNSFGAHGYLVFRDAVCTIITEESFTLPKSARGIVSVFAYGGEASGVSLSGLTYELKNAALSPDMPLGVSNATSSSLSPVISVKHGSLLIYFPRH